MVTNGQLTIAVIVSVILIVLGVAAEQVWEWKRGPEEGAIAANQMLNGKEGIEAYEAMRMSTSNVTTTIIWGIVVVGLISTWGTIAWFKFGRS